MEKSGPLPTFKAGVQGPLEASSWVWGPMRTWGGWGLSPAAAREDPEPLGDALPPSDMTWDGGSVGGSQEDGPDGVLAPRAPCGHSAHPKVPERLAYQQKRVARVKSPWPGRTS